METAFPFILQNVHRYFLYLAFVPLFFLWVDAADSIVNQGGIRIGLGVFVLFFNAALLSGYSLSCPLAAARRRGRLDCFSCTRSQRIRHGACAGSARSTAPHGVGLGEPITVTLADVYVRRSRSGHRGHRPFHL
jgi:hypothetical protein